MKLPFILLGSNVTAITSTRGAHFTQFGADGGIMMMARSGVVTVMARASFTCVRHDPVRYKARNCGEGRNHSNESDNEGRKPHTLTQRCRQQFLPEPAARWQRPKGGVAAPGGTA